MTRVGVVGAGRMGLPMVRRLAAADLHITVLARDVSAAQRLRETVPDGVEVVPTATELAGSDVVLVVVHTDEQVREVCIDGGLVAAMTRGSVLVVHTTGSPDTVREIESFGAPYGVAVVDAPVSGGPHDIDAGAITVFIGGDDDAVAAARSVLTSYADPIQHVGALGAGQTVKLVNNAVFLSNVQVLRAAGDFAAATGLDVGVAMQCLQYGSGRSAALDGAVRAGSPAAFADSVAEFLYKDAQVVLAVSRTVNADLGCLRHLLPAAAPEPDSV